MKTVCSLLFASLVLLPAVLPAVASAQESAPAPSATPAVVATATPDPCAPTPTPVPPPPPHVKSALEAGMTATSGNTNVQTWTGAAKVDGTWPTWGFAFRSSGVYSRIGKIQTAGAWDASLRGDRKIAGSASAYGRLSIDGDRFKGIENRKGAGAGIAWQVLKRKGAGFDLDLLRTELGYQYYLEDRVYPAKDQDIQAGRAFIGYAHGFSKESVATEEVEGLYDFETKDRYLLASVTALAVKLSAHMAFKASETVKIDTVPAFVDPTDETKGRFKKTDTLTAVALLVSF